MDPCPEMGPIAHSIILRNVPTNPACSRYERNAIRPPQIDSRTSKRRFAAGRHHPEDRRVGNHVLGAFRYRSCRIRSRFNSGNAWGEKGQVSETVDGFCALLVRSEMTEYPIISTLGGKTALYVRQSGEVEKRNCTSRLSAPRKGVG